MKQTEILQERFEDALFALMMDEVARQEGERALAENARLQEDPAAEVPERVQRRCLHAISRQFAKMRRRKAGKAVLRILNVAAILVCVVTVGFTGAFAASETFRVNTLNYVKQYVHEGIMLDFNTPEQVPENDGELYIGWLPENFVLQEKHVNDMASSYQYKDAEDPYRLIYINVYRAFGGDFVIDTENAQVSTVDINGYEATVTEKRYTDAETEMVEIGITWVISETQDVITVYCDNMDVETAIRVAENLSY